MLRAFEQCFGKLEDLTRTIGSELPEVSKSFQFRVLNFFSQIPKLQLKVKFSDIPGPCRGKLYILLRRENIIYLAQSI